ncbi:MAG: folate family ECF transporter S component [Ruminococcus sp.]|nr:folate family ECF transporter S component [Ruminococcus sp.]
MNTTKSKNTGFGSIRLFGNVRVMIISGLFIALSIILGKFAHIAIGDSIRISFENLPIIMAGIFFGPFVGGAVGIGADLIGCLLKGYAINPIITLGGASIGLISGFISVIAAKLPLMFRVPISVLAAHIIGSMLIKSIGLYIYYHTPREVLMLRIPLYLATAALESLIIYLLLKNKAFSNQLNKITGK